MADVFDNINVSSLLKSKQLFLIGDSGMRAQYKDLIWLLNINTIIPADLLKRKLEKSFLGDILLKRSELHRGRDFEEVRSYESAMHDIKIDYMFVTKCYSEKIVQLFNDIKEKKRPVPDVIIMNSCLWDLTRWGPDGATLYKENMGKLMTLFNKCLPKSTLVIWSTALPVASQIKGGLLIKQIEFLKHTLRFDVMEANYFARSIVANHGYDVLDTHHYMRYQVHRRASDGVHYVPVAVRYMTNLILTHIALSWDHPLPARVPRVIKERIFNPDCFKTDEVTGPSLPENFAQSSNTGLENPSTSSELTVVGLDRPKRKFSKDKPYTQTPVEPTTAVGPCRRRRKFTTNRNFPY